MSTIDKFLGIFIAIFITVNVALLILVHVETLESDKRMLSRFSGDDGFEATPDAYTYDGKRINALTDKILILYASYGCDYCRKDMAWKQLYSRVVASGYQIMVLLPSERAKFPEDYYVPGAVDQITYINIDWVKRHTLYLTPTYLFFAKNRLVYFREGIFTSRAASNVEEFVLAKQ